MILTCEMTVCPSQIEVFGVKKRARQCTDKKSFAYLWWLQDGLADGCALGAGAGVPTGNALSSSTPPPSLLAEPTCMVVDESLFACLRAKITRFLSERTRERGETLTHLAL